MHIIESKKQNNLDTINFIIHSWALPNVTCQNIFCKSPIVAITQIQTAIKLVMSQKQFLSIFLAL